MAFALEEVHAVEAEGFDFYEGLGVRGFWSGRVGVDEHVFDWAFAAFDVCLCYQYRFKLTTMSRNVPMAFMVAIFDVLVVKCRWRKFNRFVDLWRDRIINFNGSGSEPKMNSIWRLKQSTLREGLPEV